MWRLSLSWWQRLRSAFDKVLYIFLSIGIALTVGQGLLVVFDGFANIVVSWHRITY